MTGRSLRLARLRIGLRQLDVAASAGCSRSRVTQLEHLLAVPPEWVERYRSALSAWRADGATAARAAVRDSSGD